MRVKNTDAFRSTSPPTCFDALEMIESSEVEEISVEDHQRQCLLLGRLSLDRSRTSYLYHQGPSSFLIRLVRQS